MSIKIDANSINKINSDMVRKDLNRIRNSEEVSDNYASDDKVELSSRAMDLKEMQAKAMSAPDVRTEKVQSIKLKVENGTYEISTKEIAARMIDEAMG